MRNLEESKGPHVFLRPAFSTAVSVSEVAIDNHILAGTIKNA